MNSNPQSTPTDTADQDKGRTPEEAFKKKGHSPEEAFSVDKGRTPEEAFSKSKGRTPKEAFSTDQERYALKGGTNDEPKLLDLSSLEGIEKANFEDQGMTPIQAERTARDRKKHREREVYLDSLDTGQSRLGSGAASTAKSFVKPLTEDIVRSFAVAGTETGNVLGLTDMDVEDSPVYKFADKIGKGINTYLPVNPKYQDEFLTGQLPQGIGSSLGFYVGGAIGKAAGGSELAMSALLGSTAQAASEYKAAKQKGASDKQALNTYLYNLPIGASEAIPVEKGLGRINRALGGPTGHWLKSALMGGGEEFIQETGQQLGSNFVAGKTYDKTRKILDNVGQGGKVGFATGFLLNAMGVKLGKLYNDASSKSEKEDVARSQKAVQQKKNEILDKKSDEIEQETEQKRLKDEVGFRFDPEAPVEQQKSQLDSEQQRLEEDRDIRQELGAPTDNIDSALENISELQSQFDNSNAQRNSDGQQQREKQKEEHLGPPTETKNEDPVDENEAGQADQGVQKSEGQPEAGSPDSPVTANIDERYQSWVQRYDESTPTIQVKNSESGNVIDYRSNNRKDVIEDYQRQGAPGLESAQSKISEEASDLSGQEREAFLNSMVDGKGNIKPEVTLERSEDPAEIAEAIEAGKEQYRDQNKGDTHSTLTQNYWEGGQKLPVSNIKRWGDWNSLKQNIKAKARNQQKYDGKLLGADQLAQEASELMGREVTAEEMVESFIKYHQDAEGRSNNHPDPIIDELTQKFKEITGQKYTPEFGQRLQEAKQEYQLNKAEADVSNRIDQDQAINYNEEIENSGPIADAINDGKPLTKEEADYVSQQIQEAEGPRGNGEDQISSGQAEGVQSTEEKWRGFGSREDLAETDKIIEESLQEWDGPGVNMGGDLSQFSPKLLKALVKKGAYLMQDGAIEFGDWASQMISKYSEKVAPALAHIYNSLRENSHFDSDQLSSQEEVAQWLADNDVDTDSASTPTQQQQTDSDTEGAQKPIADQSDSKDTLKDRLKSRIETDQTDRSDRIKRRLKDPRYDDDIVEGLKQIKEHSVESLSKANEVSDTLISELQDRHGSEEGLVEAFNLLRDGKIPPLMQSMFAEKIAMRMQKKGMNGLALEVYDVDQQLRHDDAQGLVGARSDASPESTVSRHFAELEQGKREAMQKEFKNGKTYQDVLDDILARLRDMRQNTEGEVGSELRQEMKEEVNDSLKDLDRDTVKKKLEREEAAEEIVDKFLNDESEGAIQESLSDIADFDSLPQEAKNNLIDIAQEVSDLTAEGKKELANKKWTELMTELEHLDLKEQAWSDIFLDVWHTGILSGISTVFKSVISSGITSSMHFGSKALSNPAIAPFAIKQAIKGFRGGTGTWMNVLKTGETDVQFADFKPNGRSYTDKLVQERFSDLTIPNKMMKAAYGAPVYAFRNILAMDQVLTDAMGEGLMAINAYGEALDHSQSRLDAVKKAKKNLKVEQENEARSTAKEEIKEMEQNGEEVPSGYQERRVREILRNERQQSLVEKSLLEAKDSALVGHPKGLLGRAYKSIRDATAIRPGDGATLLLKAPFKAFFPLMRIGFNIINKGLNYTPVGFVRGAKSFMPRAGGNTHSNSRWTQNGFQEISDVDRNQFFGRAAVGMTIFGTTMASMFDWDDDEGMKLRPLKDRWIDISGPGTGNWYRNKDINDQFQSWSVRLRNPFSDNSEWTDYYTYQYNPIGFALAPIGIIADEMRFDDFAKKTKSRHYAKRRRGFSYLLGAGAQGMFDYAMDQSFNQGIKSFNKILNAESPKERDEALYNAFARPVYGFYPSLYKQMYSQYRSLSNTPERDAKTWYDDIAKKVPFVSDIVKNKQYDVFGYPVIREFDIPMVPETVLKMATENLTYRSQKKEWQLLHKYDQVTVGNFYPPEFHDGNRLTNQQRHEYEKEAGRTYRYIIGKKYHVLDRLGPERLQKELVKAKRKAAERARKVLFEGLGQRIEEIDSSLLTNN